MINPPPLMVAAIIPAQARKYVAQVSSNSLEFSTNPTLRHISRNATYLLICARAHIDKNEKSAKMKGVKRVCVSNRSTKSAERKREQKKRRFRQVKNGGPDPRGGSASPSGGTVSIAAGTKVMTE